MKSTTSLILSISIGLLTVTVSAQDRPSPDRLRAESRELMQRARELKNAGDLAESEEVARKAKNLAREADEISQQGQRERDGDRPRREGDRPRPDQERPRPEGDRVRPDRPEQRREMERRELGERREIEIRERRQEFRPEREREIPGRPSPEAQLERRGPQRDVLIPRGFGPEVRPFQPPFPGLQNRRFAPGPFAGRGPGGPQRFGPPMPPPFDGQFRRGPRPPQDMDRAAEFESKQQHLRQAIEHLHAAGLHGVAVRLEQHARRGMRR